MYSVVLGNIHFWLILHYYSCETFCYLIVLECSNFALWFEQIGVIYTEWKDQKFLFKIPTCKSVKVFGRQSSIIGGIIHKCVHDIFDQKNLVIWNCYQFFLLVLRRQEAKNSQLDRIRIWHWLAVLHEQHWMGTDRNQRVSNVQVRKRLLCKENKKSRIYGTSDLSIYLSAMYRRWSAPNLLLIL